MRASQVDAPDTSSPKRRVLSPEEEEARFLQELLNSDAQESARRVAEARRIYLDLQKQARAKGLEIPDVNMADHSGKSEEALLREQAAALLRQMQATGASSRSNSLVRKGSNGPQMDQLAHYGMKQSHRARARGRSRGRGAARRHQRGAST